LSLKGKYKCRRYLAHLFSSDRDARRHLRTLFAAGEIDILTYNDPRRPNVYVVMEQGLDHARELSTEAVPAGRDISCGDHILHEILSRRTLFDFQVGGLGGSDRAKRSRAIDQRGTIGVPSGIRAQVGRRRRQTWQG
jgi:hypothetical protein